MILNNINILILKLLVENQKVLSLFLFLNTFFDYLFLYKNITIFLSLNNLVYNKLLMRYSKLFGLIHFEYHFICFFLTEVVSE